MASGPEFSEYMRSLIRGDAAANDEAGARLNETGWDGFARYQTALFLLAVERRFGTGGEDTDIVDFVADLRADLGSGGPTIDGPAAEALIRSSMGHSPDHDLAGLEPSMVGTIQAMTIYKLLADEPLPESDLDELLSAAEVLAG